MGLVDLDSDKEKKGSFEVLNLFKVDFINRKDFTGNEGVVSALLWGILVQTFLI